MFKWNLLHSDVTQLSTVSHNPAELHNPSWCMTCLMVEGFLLHGVIRVKWYKVTAESAQTSAKDNSPKKAEL